MLLRLAIDSVQNQQSGSSWQLRQQNILMRHWPQQVLDRVSCGKFSKQLSAEREEHRAIVLASRTTENSGIS